MTIPDGVPRVTVETGPPLMSPGGTAIQGKLVFVGPSLVTVPALDLTIDGAETMLLTGGVGSVDLVPSDLDTMSPHGWTYEVRSEFTNAPNWIRYIRLTSSMGTVKLADVLVPDPVSGAYTVLLDPSTLGSAAFLDVGQTADTVAAGDDPRFSGGGGTGSAIVSQGDDRIDLEIVTLANSASWAVVRTSGGVAIGKSVKAAAGDRILVSPSFMYAGTQYELDLAVMASDGTSITRYAGSSGSGTTPGAEGYPPLYTQATSFPHITGPIMFTVAAGEVDGSGRFTVNLAYHAPSLSGTDQHIYAGAGYIARWLMLNIGPEPA